MNVTTPNVALDEARTTRSGPRWIMPSLVALLVVTVVAASRIGSVSLSFAEIAELVLQRLGVATATSPVDTHADVFFAIRLPRVILGVLVGGGLGIAGATMQGIFRNPLVDPGLLGLSTSAALGAVVTIVLGSTFAHGIPPSITPYVLPIAAFVGALLAMMLVERIARVDGRMAVSTLLLAGIAVNALASSLTGFFMYVSTDAQLRTITFWSLGSLGGATTQTVLATALFLGIPLLLLVKFGRALNALLLGEAEAGHLGVDIERAKRTMFVLVALVVGAAVGVSGVLGFVGLVVPHLLRLAVGPDHRTLLPGSALLGASLLVAADAVARTVVSPAELPLGIVTASLGTPFFVALLLRERRRFA